MAKKKVKYNNPHKVPNEIAELVWNLDNQELISKTSLEFKNWKMHEKNKKNDGRIERLKEEKKEAESEINNHPDVLELKEKIEAKKRELELEDDGELARIKEELKNEQAEYNHDIRETKALFFLCMDELNKRMDLGSIAKKEVWLVLYLALTN